MSLTKNIVANYASQIYIALIGVVMVPFYIKHLGAETYGLVGFFAMLQAWFAVLDMGLTPTVAREAARFTAGAADSYYFRRLMRTLEYLFAFGALVGGGILFMTADVIATRWLHASNLPAKEVTAAIRLMSITIALRWMCGPYRGAITGWERLAWLGAYSSLIATLRFVIVVPVILLLAPTPTVFFGYQLVVAMVEVGGLFGYTRKLMQREPRAKGQLSGDKSLVPLLKFSLAIAFTSSIWILITQTDKLILSKILPLAEYGYFTLGVLVAGVVTIVSAPVSSAILPRLARLEAFGDEEALISLYRQSTQVVAVLAGSLAVTVAFGAESLILLWTGNRELAVHSAPILRLYALGNGVLTLAAFPYYLQYAKGNLRLHLIGNAVFVALLVPVLIWATRHYGAIGAGYAWLSMNIISLFGWSPIVHHRMVPGLNRTWFLKDVFAIVVPMTITASLMIRLLSINDGKWVALSKLSLNGAITLAIATACSSWARKEAGIRMSRWLRLRNS